MPKHLKQAKTNTKAFRIFLRASNQCDNLLAGAQNTTTKRVKRHRKGVFSCDADVRRVYRKIQYPAGKYAVADLVRLFERPTIPHPWKSSPYDAHSKCANTKEVGIHA